MATTMDDTAPVKRPRGETFSGASLKVLKYYKLCPEDRRSISDTTTIDDNVYCSDGDDDNQSDIDDNDRSDIRDIHSPLRHELKHGKAAVTPASPHSLLTAFQQFKLSLQKRLPVLNRRSSLTAPPIEEPVPAEEELVIAISGRSSREEDACEEKLRALQHESLTEELQALQRHHELQMMTFPFYFSPAEETLLREVAHQESLGYQKGEKFHVVYKVKRAPPPQGGVTCVSSLLTQLMTGKMKQPRRESKAMSLPSRDSCKPRVCPSIVVVPTAPSCLNLEEFATMGHSDFLTRCRLERMDSASNHRKNMLWDIAQSNHVGPFHPTHATDRAVTLPGIYSVQASRDDGQPVALFKPAEEETFVREGLQVGEGAVREEAAYLLDAIAGGYSRVPPTTVATLHLRLTTKNKEEEDQGKNKDPEKGEKDQVSSSRGKSGAIQRFMACAVGGLDEFAMPRDAVEADAFIPCSALHSIGLLDLRLFNTDRHVGNLLVLGHSKPHGLVPIDHGCILPSWFHLSEGRFDWSVFPQAAVPFSPDCLEYIAHLNSRRDATILRQLGIREECIVTMEICTAFLIKGAAAGKTLRWMATFMQRDGCLESPCDLELVIHQACAQVGIPLSFVPNTFGEVTGQLVLGVLSRRPPRRFFTVLETLFDALLCENNSTSTSTSNSRVDNVQPSIPTVAAVLT